MQTQGQGHEADFGMCFYKPRNIRGGQQTLRHGRETRANPPRPQKEPNQTQPSSLGHRERKLGPRSSQEFVLRQPQDAGGRGPCWPGARHAVIFTDVSPAANQGSPEHR